MEFSFLIHPSELEAIEKKFVLNPESSEKIALAKRFGFEEIKIFTINVFVKAIKSKHAVRVSGKINAKIVQNCVVSMVPIESIIDETFEVDFYDISHVVTETFLDDGLFEVYENDIIDLGELGAQELALAANPYPRAEGLADEVIGPYLITKEDKKNKPFAALAGIKQKK
ncbi:MAG: hypothetical protein CMM83_03465 [Rhodospirillales bacterium]|nr:hypothetical protein [Rhodospirillaceae bacterium]MBS40772.1 hypothetical protein [Rhodospirillales bacterium]|tara:strand:+ start:115 stop:624 length:510 start_codon:yes stop_codon:yes gene_type:complete